MSRIMRKELTNQIEINIFEFDGYCGFPAGSDAVLAFRGAISPKPEEKILYALGSTRTNQPGFQSVAARALNSAIEFVQMESVPETFTAYAQDLELIIRGQGNVKVLSEKNLNIALEAIRQRQDQAQ